MSCIGRESRHLALASTPHERRLRVSTLSYSRSNYIAHGGAGYGDGGKEFTQIKHQGQRGETSRTTGRRHDRTRDVRKTARNRLTGAPSRHDSAGISMRRRGAILILFRALSP